MSIEENKTKAKESLNTLKDIATKIENALAESDDYWTWAGFYKEKKDELMPIKDRGKEAVKTLQEAVESIRENLNSGAYESIFDEIDRKKANVKDVVEELREMGSVKAAIMNGEELADLLYKLLDRFRETSRSVEKLLISMEENEN